MRRWMILVLLALAACSTTPAQPTTIATQPAEAGTTVGVAPTPQAVAGTPTPNEQQPPATPTLPTEVPATAPQTTTTPPPASAGGGILIVPSGTDGSIWALDPRTGEQVVLVDPTDNNQPTSFSVSPDGKTIAAIIIQGPRDIVQGDELTIPTSVELWVVNIDATNPRKLVSLIPEAGIQSIPTLDNYWTELHIFGNPIYWSATDELVVGSLHEGQPDLYAVSINDGSVRRLTDTPQIESELKIDGTRRVLGYSAWTAFPRGVLGTRPAPEVWIQDLQGSPTLAIPEEIRRASDGISLHGWLGDQLIVDGTMEVGNNPLAATLFHMRLNQPLETLTFPKSIGVALQNDKAIINSEQVLLWDGHNAAQPISNKAYSYYTLAPDQQKIYGCNAFFTHPNNTDEHYQRGIITLTGERISLAAGVCGTALWSPDSQWIAMGAIEQLFPEPESANHGYLTNLNGQEIDLGVDVVVAGWIDGDLLYFAPQNEQWQLYRLTPGQSGQGDPIGKPLDFKPYEPQQSDA